MTPKRIVQLVLFLLVAGTAGLLGWQNHPTRVNMVFKVTPDYAWDLGQLGQPLVLLLGVAFGAGVLATLILMLGRLSKSSRDARTWRRKAEALEDELEFHKGGSSSSV
jgi:Flp pilus assembly protein CpaB